MVVFSYKEMVDKFNVEYIPGGATQNSMRVAQVSKCNIHCNFFTLPRETNKKWKKKRRMNWGNGTMQL